MRRFSGRCFLVKAPEICAVITGNDAGSVAALELAVDLFELRLDLIGKGWRDVVAAVRKPWIAACRPAAEGGKWKGSEAKRLAELDSAVELGARYVDIELTAPGVAEAAAGFKGKARVIVSYHDFTETPPLDRLRQIIINQLAAGAEICKVVTTALQPADNITVMNLISLFPDTRVVAFCMGPLGQVSRVLSPLAGGCFTYASAAAGKESASGQLTVAELRAIYAMLEKND